MRRLARVSPVALFVLAALVGLAIVLFRSYLPWLTAQHQETASTPGLGALFQRAEVHVKRGQQACIRPVFFSSETQVARLRVLAPRAPVPALQITATAPGYRSGARVSRYDVGGDTLVTANLKDPGQVRVGQLCVKNVGRHQMSLVGTNEARSQVVADTVLDGQPIVGTDVELTLLHRGTTDYVASVGDVLRHASTLAATWTPTWLLWPLLILLVIGVPAGAVFALARAFARTP